MFKLNIKYPMYAANIACIKLIFTSLTATYFHSLQLKTFYH